jgi:hypothetical protein
VCDGLIDININLQTIVKEHISILVGRYSWMFVKLVPTLMIDDAETKMLTEVAVLFELKTSVPFCHNCYN